MKQKKLSNRERNKKNNHMVYVLDINGLPLMPTNRCGKVKHMLRHGEAKVVNLMPFTIQLQYEPKNHKVDRLHVSIDPGFGHIGISVTTEKKELYRSEILPETGMKKRMETRRSYRRDRRNRKTRYRKPRFNNRVASKKEGWLAPSVLRLCETHIAAIKRLFKFLPLDKETTICVPEICGFDTQNMKNSDISGVDYQHGDLYGYENRRQFVLSRDKCTCQICKGNSGDKQLQVHHIQFRSNGGTNDVNNLITLCKTCHDKIHNGELNLKKKLVKSYIPAANVSSMKTRLVEELKNLFDNVECTYGYITKVDRKQHDIPKSHCNDAFTMCKCFNATRLNYHYVFRQVCRHTRALHKHDFIPGGKRTSKIAQKHLPNGFLRYDKVYCKSLNVYGFIYGSTNGYPVLKDINGNKVMEQNSITTKKLKLVYRTKGSYMVDVVKYKDNK